VNEKGRGFNDPGSRCVAEEGPNSAAGALSHRLQQGFLLDGLSSATDFSCQGVGSACAAAVTGGDRKRRFRARSRRSIDVLRREDAKRRSGRASPRDFDVCGRNDQNVELRGDSGDRSTFWLLYDQNVEPHSRSAPNSTFWSLPRVRDPAQTHALNASR
jgi:hypothetical protein